MTKKEYIQQRKLITNSYGLPEYEAGTGSPVNESAKRLILLEQAYKQAVSHEKNLKELEQTAKENQEHLTAIEIPDYLIRSEWLLSFKENEKLIVFQYLKNTRQTTQEIALRLNLPLNQVKAVFKLEAFGVLSENLSKAYINSKKLEVAASLVSLLTAKTDSVRLKAAELLAYDAGLIKATSSPEMASSVPQLDPEAEASMRKLAEELRKRSG